jgi:uncharacterized phage protein (TIGR02218 family)
MIAPNWITPALTTLAFCWKLSRRDGITLGFTSHDRDLTVGGLLYRATPGMVPSAIERSISLEPDNVDLSGVLTSDAITARDLTAGRWDGASLTLFAVDWTAPENTPLPLVRGTLGAVSIKGDAFSVELNGPTSILDAAVVEETSPECRATLGDKRCGVDLAGRSLTLTISQADDIILSVAGALAANDYAQGRLRWLDGPNAGLEGLILANDASHITLADPPPLMPLAGDRIEIRQGCDRRFTTCTGRFANALNFRGEPHLPGNDLLTRYAS